MGADEAKQRLKAYAAWKTGNMGLMLPNKKKVFETYVHQGEGSNH